MKLFLIDAYALIFKFYYAFISRPMRNKDGLNTSAIFGFSKFINDIITSERPDYLGVAFDVGGKTFRHEMFPEYKGNRSETPEDIIASTPHIKRILNAMGIPVLEMRGYEADDIIGTISSCASKEGFEVFMVTPDKDYAQLIKDNVYMYKPSKSGNGVEIVGMHNLFELYGVENPQYIIDILALWGDASDNIPGVPGIGEKTARKLVNEYGTVEQILDNVDKIKGKNGKNLVEFSERLHLSKKLTTIDTNVPIDFCTEKLKLEHPDYDALRALYHEMGFTTLLQTVDFWQRCKGDDCNDVVEATKTVERQEAKVENSITTQKGEQLDMFAAEESSVDTPISASTSLFEGGLLFAEKSFDTIKTTHHNYTTITTIDEAQKLSAMLSLHKKVCFDTETTSLNCMSAKLVGISFAVEEHNSYYVALYPEDRAQTIAMLDCFNNIFSCDSIAKIGQNIKYDLLVLKNYGIEVFGTLYDTMVIHYLLDSDARHGMDYLADKYLNYRPIEIEELIGKGARQKTMDMVPLDKIAEYASEDADVTLRLYNKLWRELQTMGLEELYMKIEEPLIGVLTQMEFNGVKLDSAALDVYGSKLRSELESIEEKIIGYADGDNININSPKQLGVLLFEKLMIDPKPKKTKTKSYKTDEEYLLTLKDKHPVVELILEYRSIKKLLSTYIEALPQLINPKTGRIHTTYNQTVASTGRLSSNNPNLQNIPIRDERGKNVRAAFIADGKENILISADYSQVELRIMAALSGDSSMIEAFNMGEDIHTATAAKVFGVELSEVTAEQRRRAKTANFGIIYGISPFGLSQRLGISRKEATELIDGYFEHYPKVKEYMDGAIAKAREDGYCTTLFGRRKNLPDITAANAIVRAYAERNAINAPIQGSAADIIKIAMSKLQTALKSNGLEAKIIMQVHDELVVECSITEKERVEKVIVESMESAVDLVVKLVAECGSGSNWLQAH